MKDEKAEKINVTQLADAERQMIAHLESCGIRVCIAKLHGARIPYRCRVRIGADPNRSAVAYGKTPEEAVRGAKKSALARWPEVFDKQDGPGPADLDG